MTKIEGGIFRSIDRVLTNYAFYLFLLFYCFYVKPGIFIDAQNFLLILILVTVPYLVAMLIIVCCFNSSILIQQEKIVLYNNPLSFNTSYSFEKEQIVTIKMKADRSGSAFNHSSFPVRIVKYFSFLLPLPDYKWIEVCTKTHTRKFYFFGIEYDYYDNPKPYFEDIYVYLRVMDYNVEWTNESHIWPGLEEQIRQIKRVDQ